MFERILFQDKLWCIIRKIPQQRVDKPKELRTNYGCDLVITDKTHYWILEEIIDVEFEEINDVGKKKLQSKEKVAE